MKTLEVPKKKRKKKKRKKKERKKRKEKENIRVPCRSHRAEEYKTE